MKRIIVVSDTHGRIDAMTAQILKQSNIDYIIHLGDHAEDAKELEYLTSRRILSVRGNNDYSSIDVPWLKIIEIEGYRLLLTHGHKQNVYFNHAQLINEAKINHCDFALYGHTHRYYFDLEDGIYVLNPGSASLPRDGVFSYALLELDAKNKPVVTRVEL